MTDHIPDATKMVPEALRLADHLERFRSFPDDLAAAAELRRLHAENGSLRADAERYRWLAKDCRSTSEHWGGRWSIVIEGPCPESHNCEDGFDAAIDAAMKRQS